MKVFKRILSNIKLRYLYKDKLQKQLDVLEGTSYNFCYSNFYNMYGEKLVKASKSLRPSGDIFKYQIANYSIGILTVMLRKSAWDKMEEKFDKNFSYPGDLDFFIRFLHKNQAIYIDEPLAIYRADNPNSISNTKKQNNISQVKEAYNKLETLFLDDTNSYEFGLYKDRVVRAEAGYFFRNKEYKKCRELINPTKFKSKKSFIVYLATFLPNFVLDFVSNRV